MLILTIGVYRRAGTALAAGQLAILLTLRIAGVALLLLVLLQPSRLETLLPPAADRVTLVGLDTSKSMAQRDVAQGTRAEEARSILTEAGLIAPDGTPRDSSLRLFAFSEDATSVPGTSGLETNGPSTRVHRSISTMLGSLRGQEHARALVLLSDGHDLELVNPAKTGFLARSRQVPIFAVPLGRQGKVRDISVRITSYQPYTYVKQKAQISAALRLIGCELETFNVDLLRGDQVVQTKKIPGSEEPEITVSFEVTEPAVGQFEYEVRVRPLDREADRDNNTALTYLNVVDQQIQILFLEGAPYWDTTFLSRSLLRNDKMNVDSIVQYAPGKARRIRKAASATELKLPATVEDWQRYDVVVLGRSIENLLGRDDLQRLEDSVRDHGSTVIFARGPAFSGALAKNELEPVLWSKTPSEHVRLQVSREGQTLAPFRAIQAKAGAETVPELIAVYPVQEKKPLTATLAEASPAAGGQPLPSVVHRRFGDGQVLSVGVDGLWRWAFNAGVDGPNTVFDRFWDQMILWLMAGRDFLPAQKYGLRASSANIPLGEKIYFRVLQRDVAAPLSDLSLTIEHGNQETVRTTLGTSDSGKLAGEFLPGRPGKYTATAQFPDGTSQSVRFAVFDENLEQTEVATDANYLRKLCESSGGRLVTPDELGKLLDEWKDPVADTEATEKRTALWDRWWVFWTIGLLLGGDWYLRRRWGLC